MNSSFKYNFRIVQKYWEKGGKCNNKNTTLGDFLYKNCLSSRIRLSVYHHINSAPCMLYLIIRKFSLVELSLILNCTPFFCSHMCVPAYIHIRNLRIWLLHWWCPSDGECCRIVCCCFDWTSHGSLGPEDYFVISCWAIWDHSILAWGTSKVLYTYAGYPKRDWMF